MPCTLLQIGHLHLLYYHFLNLFQAPPLYAPMHALHTASNRSPSPPVLPFPQPIPSSSTTSSHHSQPSISTEEPTSSFLLYINQLLNLVPHPSPVKLTLEYSVPTKAPVSDHLMRTRSKTGIVCPKVQPTLLGPWLLMLGQMDSQRPGRYTRRLKKGRKDCKPFIFVDTD
ncbi:hypothetical protein QL285_038002 [Trifolium repens]|nr:hypothetical protein QL285_038002 [Trifolium repens]